jgi:hypothetical protein
MAEQSNNHDPNVFAVDTRFQQLARRQGGVSRERAIESAQRQIDNMKTDFANWLDRELQELATSVEVLDLNRGDMGALDRAHQACCGLRDVGTTMGYELVTFVADNFCGVLDAMKAGAPYDREMIDCHIDAFLLARTEPYCNMRPDQVPEMTRGLRRVVELASANAAREAK